MKKKKSEELPRSRRVSMTFLLVAGLIGTIIAVTAGSVSLFLKTYQQSLIRNAETSSRQTVSQVSTTVQGYLEDVDSMITLLGEELEEPVRNRDDFFDALLRIRPDIVAVTTYDEAGTLMDCRCLNREPRSPIFENLSFSLKEARQRQNYISTPHVLSLFEGYYPWVVSVISPVETDTGEAWVSMDIQFRDISSYINNVGIGRHGYCYLMDGDGNIIYHPQQQLLYTDLKEENTQIAASMADGTKLDSNVIYSVQTIPLRNWRVVGVSFVDEIINASLQDVWDVLTVAGIIIVITSLFMSLAMSRLLSRPIKNLAEAMRQFEKDGDSFTYTPVTGIREVELLSESFGHMVGKIQGLMETVREEEVNLRKTELRALQAQINPHFLYNTLDSIAWMCERGKTADAVEMVNSLARLFRISISRGHELIPVRSELQHAESYLKIQAHRYRDQFSYEFKVDESCLDYLCNKITLQPIIENAIYHGINGLVDEGEIIISVTDQGDDILMAVEDNGNGMEPEVVQAILQKERSDHAGIGIKNVNDRLKIYFGPKYGITIHSVPDEGTRVEILMPKVTEASDYENR